MNTRIVVCEDRETALKKWFDFHFYTLKMGIIMAITGNFNYRFGVGKSYTALKLGELIDKEFSIDKVVFEPKDFKKAMELVEESGKISQVLVIDEAGILVNAKKWFSFINRGISAAMMTFRELRGLAIAVTPALRFIDSDIRIMLSHWGECYKVVEGSGPPKVLLKLYKVSWSETENKYYRYKIVMFNKTTNQVERFDEFRVGLPNKELTDEYERRVKAYKAKVRRMAIDENLIVEDMENIEKTVEEVLKNKDLVKPTKSGNKVFYEDLKIYYGFSVMKARMIARKCNERLEAMKNG